MPGSSEQHPLITGGGVGNSHIPGEGPITLREVYALIDVTRKELLAEIAAVTSDLRTYSQVHEREHKDHDREHRNHEQRHIDEVEQSRKARSGLIRWAVTSILTGVGVLIALYVAFSG